MLWVLRHSGGKDRTPRRSRQRVKRDDMMDTREGYFGPFSTERLVETRWTVNPNLNRTDRLRFSSGWQCSYVGAGVCIVLGFKQPCNAAYLVCDTFVYRFRFISPRCRRRKIPINILKQGFLCHPISNVRRERLYLGERANGASPQIHLTPHLVHVLVVRQGQGVDAAVVVITPRVRV